MMCYDCYQTPGGRKVYDALNVAARNYSKDPALNKVEMRQAAQSALRLHRAYADWIVGVHGRASTIMGNARTQGKKVTYAEAREYARRHCPHCNYETGVDPEVCEGCGAILVSPSYTSQVRVAIATQEEYEAATRQWEIDRIEAKKKQETELLRELQGKTKKRKPRKKKA
jgi:ribosomal protein L37AE/L43A